MVYLKVWYTRGYGILEGMAYLKVWYTRGYTRGYGILEDMVNLRYKYQNHKVKLSKNKENYLPAKDHIQRRVLKRMKKP